MNKKFISLFVLIISIFFIILANAAPINLNVESSYINIKDKKVKVYKVVQDNGKDGYVGTQGKMLNLFLHNKTKNPITIHWHGLVNEYTQDGVPYVTQLPLAPGKTEHIKFPLVQSGTFWMHSHYGLQEAQLMSAPLIIKSKSYHSNNVKNVAVILDDLSIKSPKKILFNLKHPANMGKMMAMNSDENSKPDLYDVKSDVILANRKTLNNPDIIKATAGEEIKLRLINADSVNNLFVHLPKNMIGKVIAIDGEKTNPYYNTTFQLGIANTMDILVTVPKVKSGFYPIYFQAEGRKIRSGIILKVGNTPIPKLSQFAQKNDPAFSYIQDYNLHPEKPLISKKIDRTLTYHLNGNMMSYKWSINGEYWPDVKPKFVKKGERVKIVIYNDSGMAHPMHFHGHVFQLVAINGQKIDGYKGNTVVVLPKSKVSLIFNANDPGIWAFHCHLLYHLGAGMMTTINYTSITPQKFYLDKIGMTLSQYNLLKKQEIKQSVEK